MKRKTTKSSKNTAKKARKAENYQTNWDDLPEELKCKCMEQLDYKSSVALSSTCHSERTRFESSAKLEKAFPWNAVHIYFYLETDTVTNFSVMAYADDQEIEMCWNSQQLNPTFEKVLSFLAHVLKHGKLEKLRFEYEGNSPLSSDFFKRLENSAPFRVQEFWSHHYPPEASKFFLKNCERAPEVVQFFEYSSQVGRVFYQMIRMENFIKANHIKTIIEKPKLKMFATIAEKWMEHDVPIGVQFFNKARTPFRLFLHYFHKKFENRVHSENLMAVRIRTDNPAKHIVFSEEIENGQYMCVTGAEEAETPDWGEIWDEEGHYNQDLSIYG